MLARNSVERTTVDDIHVQSSQIATAAEGQHPVGREINRHIEQIHTDAQRIKDLARSAHHDSQRLEALSAELNGLVARFRT